MTTAKKSAGTMKAVIYEAPGKVAYREIGRPVCGPDDVIVAVRRIGICGTDVEMFRGHIGKVTFPIVPGHEWVGEIAEIGANVTGFAPGDRVVGETTIPCGRCARCKAGAYNLCSHLKENGIFGKNGAACEYMAYPAAGLHKLNAELDVDKACLIEPSAVVFRGLEKMGLSPRDVLAVIGPGTIGLLTVAVAKHFGVRKVVLVGLQESRLELGLKLGADAVINPEAEDYAERARELTGGELFTAIVEASGSADALERLFAVAGAGCKVLLLGTYGERLPRVDANRIVDNDMVVHGSVSSPGVWDAVVEWMQSSAGEGVAELITHHFRLGQYEEALKLIERRDPDVIKVLIHPDGTP